MIKELYTDLMWYGYYWMYRAVSLQVGEGDDYFAPSLVILG